MSGTITVSRTGFPFTNLTEEEQWKNFIRVFCLAASFQGGAAYLAMSIHAVSPSLLTTYLTMSETVTIRNSSEVYQSAIVEAQYWHNFVRLYTLIASFQGSMAYFLMSIHAVNPLVLNTIFGFNPYYYIWVTMLYGIAVMIMSRPALRPISPINRIAFGILASLMFCHASMDCFEWLNTMYPDQTYWRTFLGFFSGRIMMVHLLAFLYHMDTRTNIPGVHVHRDRAFEQMYIYP